MLLVYDITNLQSFEKINYFRQDFENYSEGKLPMILVANKSDSRDRQVTTEQGSELAKILSIPFVECSALTGAQVNKIFEILLEEIIKKNPKESTNLTGSFVINTTVKQPKRNKQCCFDN